MHKAVHRAHESARYPCLPPIAREKMSMLQSRFVSMTLGVAALLAPVLADARHAQTAKWVNVRTGRPRCLGEFTSGLTKLFLISPQAQPHE